MSFLGKLAQVCAELEAHHEDPWRKKVEAAVRDKDAISTAALLDLFVCPRPQAQRAASLQSCATYISFRSSHGG